MHEFSSISVSSYEAGTLAERLTEQSREGWQVVAIVPTGSSVTAYLSRAGDGGSDAVADAPAAVVAESTASESTDDSAAHNAGAAAMQTADAASQSESGAEASTDGDDDARDESTGEAGDEGDGDVEATDPTTEAPGWAAGSGSTDAPTDTAPGDDAPTNAAPAAASQQGAESVPAAAVGAAAAGATAAAGGAPAGWYADPSSRFELRYWDGTQWTEHVSRGGQQFTDPPVA